MGKNLQLSSMIHAVYGSESQMAKTMGWSRQRLNRITNGKKVPDLFELDDIASALNTPFLSVAHIFLRERSTNVDFNPLDYHV